MWWIITMIPLILLGVVGVIILIIALVDQTETSPLQTTATLKCYHCGEETAAAGRTCRHCGGELQ